jgi:hypothetical protein
MKLLRLFPALVSVLLLFTFDHAAAQAQTAALPRGCVWNCYHIMLPYGLNVREVTDGGSLVTLEDGSVWEIRMPQRPVASSWQPGDFVVLRTIPAPVQNYDILLTHGDYDRAEARLSGRAHASSQE